MLPTSGSYGPSISKSTSCPDRCREIFRRTYLDGCKSRDIAAELGISQRTVEAQLYKALKLLRRSLTGILTLAAGWFSAGKFSDFSRFHAKYRTDPVSKKPFRIVCNIKGRPKDAKQTGK